MSTGDAPEPRPPLWPAYLATYTYMVGGWAAAIAVPLHVVALGASLAEAGLLASIRFGLQAILQLPFGAMAAGAAGYAAMVIVLGFQSAVPLLVGVMVTGVVMLAFTLMLVQVTISEVARPELRATGLGGYGTALSTGLGVGPFLAGGVADIGGFVWGFGATGAAGIGVACVAAVVLRQARRRAEVVVVATER